MNSSRPSGPTTRRSTPLTRSTRRRPSSAGTSCARARGEACCSRCAAAGRRPSNWPGSTVSGLMLTRLMILLVEQERRQEALQLYQYTEDVLHEEQAEPAVYTHELARRIRQGLVLRERGERYTAVRVQTLFLLRQDGLSRDNADGF